MWTLVLVTLAAGDAIHKEHVVPAPVAEVWKAWTTSEGAKTFFGPDANIELAEGGPYEIYFSNTAGEGQRGSEDCTVVSFEANRRLTFTWNFPPSLPRLRGSGAHTNVTVTLAPQGSGTKVTLDQGPFEVDADWQKGKAYFERAWDVVLSRLERRFKRGPIDFGWPFSVTDLKFIAGTWKLGDDKHGGQELWVMNDSDLTGMYREVMEGKAGFFELMNITREDDNEVVLSMRMYDRGLKDAKKTAGAPIRFVLERLEGQKATLIGEGTNKASLVYELKNPHHLSVTLDRNDGAPPEHFEFGRFFP